MVPAPVVSETWEPAWRARSPRIASQGKRVPVSRLALAEALLANSRVWS